MDNNILKKEEVFKEKVYTEFEHRKSEADYSVDRSKRYVWSDAFEEQDSFFAYSTLGRAERERHYVEHIFQDLYKKPYFAHIELKDMDEEDINHIFLSDSENLQFCLPISNMGMLLPFKKDENRPISEALFHCYQAKDGSVVSYKNDFDELITVKPLAIFNDEIDNRHLLSAHQMYPQVASAYIDADELLDEKLKANRHSPALQNIIATLQKLQFEVIAKDINVDFILQGCAGSGKSQVLIHRLFYLRDNLSNDGWDKVLLITPTQLFRNYSAELMRRYQLTNIRNNSIASLYQQVLNAYDKRFRNRQYIFELSEEYLPDEYLQVVYDKRVIEGIEFEIKKAVEKYVGKGSHALGVEEPNYITAEYIKNLINLIDKSLENYEVREHTLQQDPEYISRRKKYDELYNDLEKLKKKQDKLHETLIQLDKDETQLNDLLEIERSREKEREEWIGQRKDRIARLQEEHDKVLSDLERDFNFTLVHEYNKNISKLRDSLVGKTKKEDNDYQNLLDEYCKEIQQEIYSLTEGKKIEKVMENYLKKKNTTTQNIEKISIKMNMIESAIEEYESWLQIKNSELSIENNDRIFHRKELESARYFLSRIESTVFEKEVWNFLEPIKKQYSIKTLQIDQLENGNKKETRILYKSDLLFYIKIYYMLHSELDITDYKLICIDEGQDLHPADYDMIKKLFPKAILNVFGDTTQVLHNSCGIKNWKTDTSIKSVFTINRNYRNNAAIVEFCNDKFGIKMGCVGKIINSDVPVVIHDTDRLNTVLKQQDISIIVRDRNAFSKLCLELGLMEEEFEYLDTNSQGIGKTGIPCYSIFAAKGLEFPKVLVYSPGMTLNQKVVACTRAMEKLYYYEY